MDRFVVLRAGAERKGVAVAALVLELPDLAALAFPKPVHRADLGIAGKRRAIEAPVKATSEILHWCRVRMRIVHSNTHPSDEMP
jgi:hypothetical protein